MLCAGHSDQSIDDRVDVSVEAAYDMCWRPRLRLVVGQSSGAYMQGSTVAKQSSLAISSPCLRFRERYASTHYGNDMPSVQAPFWGRRGRHMQ